MNKDPVILVLEDEQPLLEVIKKKLELRGFSVVTARSVEQALEYLGTMPEVGAIWLDHYLLGKEDGLDFISRLKNSKQAKHIPIFVVSNTASPEKMQSYLHLGVAKYYTKADYRLDQIIADIKVALADGKSLE